MNNNFVFPQVQNPYAYPSTGTGTETLLPPLQAPVQTVALRLNQIQGFEPVKTFTDSTNTRWQLVKDASDSTVDVPDPASLQVVDEWCHEYPGLKKDKVYIYVVEGIRLPRVETEKPARILYQWFALSFVPNFSHTMIQKKEWLKANVYAAPIADSRYSKLYALCKYSGDKEPEESQNDNLLNIGELNAGSEKPAESN